MALVYPKLEAKFEYQPRVVENDFGRFFLRHPTSSYLSIPFLTLLVIVLIICVMQRDEVSWAFLLFTALLALIPASDLALAILNWDVTHFFEPHLLPRMDTAASGLPESARTFVVVPTLFSSEAQVSELIERLEVHFLANQEEQIYFAILGDFPDAATEVTANDDGVLALAQSGIEELNRKHTGNEYPKFHLFHRRRVWNNGEQKWMGWERKRGKLEEFNRLLRANGPTTFIVNTADQSLLDSTRYVITLDSDTQLPRDVARTLIGTAIHPLNKAEVDPSINRVVRGYGILQPRVSISLSSSSHSKFAEVFSGNTGIDPYTTAVSDVYQDLFGEGSFTGKGLYDVDAFQTTLNDRVPENALLSHDLFESLFARAALTTDIELLDDYPSSYEAYSKRLHRWTRGDWQILRWILPTVQDASGQSVPNQLQIIGRWKILDNIRRSLVAPSLFIWLVAACAVFPGRPLLWSLFVLLNIAFPVYLHVSTGLLIHPRGIPWTSHFWTVWGDIRTNTFQILLTFLFLPHQAYLMADAIIRTLYRKLISHKNLLEWVSAAEAERSARKDFSGFLTYMLPAVLLTIVAFLMTLAMRRSATPVMLGFSVFWLFAPLIAYLVSKNAARERQSFTTDEIALIRRIARRTWRFFETFVGPQDNWLPPDNFQEDPNPVIAHRTSPTNIGLLLLATASARDLGYVSCLEFVERQELTLSTVNKLKKLHGHLFNWYDTTTLEPLLPQYISTVDSGNLAGHLHAVKQACVELPELRLFNKQLVEGLTDTIDAIAQEVSRLGELRQRTEVVTVSQLGDEVAACRTLARMDTHENLASWFVLLDSLSRRASEIEDIVNALSHEHGEVNFKELRWWVGALQNQVLMPPTRRRHPCGAGTSAGLT